MLVPKAHESSQVGVRQRETSEEGWQGFLDAKGIEHWVVLHGGATVVFRTRTLATSAALAVSVASIPGLEGSGALLTLANDRLTVRLSRDLWQLEPRHIDLARRITEVARAHAAVPVRAAVQEAQVAIPAKRDAIDVSFWRAVLGYGPMADDNAVDPLGHGSTIWMQELPETKELRHATTGRARILRRPGAAGKVSQAFVREDSCCVSTTIPGRRIRAACASHCMRRGSISKRWRSTWRRVRTRRRRTSR